MFLTHPLIPSQEGKMSHMFLKINHNKNALSGRAESRPIKNLLTELEVTVSIFLKNFIIAHQHC